MTNKKRWRVRNLSLRDPYITYGCMECMFAKESICQIYPFPAAWFRYGKVCPFAYSPKETKVRKRIGQQKSKKG